MKVFNPERYEVLLGNLKGMLHLRYTLLGLSAAAADPESNVNDHEGWARLNNIDQMEIETLREAIKFMEDNPPQKIIVSQYA